MTFFGYDLVANIGAIAMLGFLLMTFFAAALTLILLWHWNKYAINKKDILLAEAIYLTGLVVLGGGAFFELKSLI